MNQPPSIIERISKSIPPWRDACMDAGGRATSGTGCRGIRGGVNLTRYLELLVLHFTPTPSLPHQGGGENRIFPRIKYGAGYVQNDDVLITR